MFSDGSLGLNVGEMLNMGAVVSHARVIVMITRLLWALGMGEVGHSIVLPLGINTLGVEKV